ncbi:hypothetical protein N7492_001820 [Penicillium capsulatum]|uniref:SMODS and SLOG-associating 2TM effector domain-containing protein n=1 Tax=Penicillium capsulatum TaxID=69766 RepID=A0A9W9IUE4_9EURO|nr:hypothetical protein N7492_001820 [Penicillium capsulatum]KAJ6129131.1 hypothetical protein N7512_001911 [Penicillium capsulatum]
MSDSVQVSRQDPQGPPWTYSTFEAATLNLRKTLTRKVQHQRFEYHLVSLTFNLLAVAQVIIGAAITALGPAADGHMLAITILGAFNTSIAGILALLKGRGLPHRLRRNMVELERVLEFIQENEALLRYGDNDVLNNGESLVHEVFERYAMASQIIESNEPDTYTGGTAPQSTSPIGTSDQKAAKGNSNGKGRQVDEEMGRDSL